MNLTAAHWIYLAGVVVIIGVMIARRNIVVPAIVATFLTAWCYSGSLVTGVSSIFSASMTAAGELFSIFLIIALVTGLLGAMRAMGAEQRMVRPFQLLMRNRWMAFVTLAGVTYFVSLFFWPTPAVPLIGAILLPAAIRAGLPMISAAAAIAIAGQGMALSSDYVIQVAPGLSAKAAGVSTGAVADRALVLSIITGLVALAWVYWKSRRSLATAQEEVVREAEQSVTATGAATGTTAATTAAAPAARVQAASAGAGSGAPAPAATGARTLVRTGPEGADGADGVTEATDAGDMAGAAAADPAAPAVSGADAPVRRSRAFAVIVPLAFAAIVCYVLVGKFTGLVPEVAGGDGAALVGGTALLLLIAAAFSLDRMKGLNTSAEHVVEGMVFAFRTMGVVIPIAGFFFIGNSDFITRITGVDDGGHPPALLFDLVTSVHQYIPDGGPVLAFAILIIGLLTGLDGSGFSGLPLTGSLAGALGPGAGVDPSTLAAVGQMGSVWGGGGVLIAWSSLLAVAGVAKVPVQELVRHCFLPVVVGLAVATALSTVLF